MAEAQMSDMIRTSLEGIRELAERETFIGEPILTASGVTVIPVSKITIGFATGGIDYSSKRFSTASNFGGGGGSGVSIIPLAFLTVNGEGQVDLIPIETAPEADALIRTIDLIEKTPDLIKRIKNALFS